MLGPVDLLLHTCRVFSAYLTGYCASRPALAATSDDVTVSHRTGRLDPVRWVGPFLACQLWLAGTASNQTTPSGAAGNQAEKRVNTAAAACVNTQDPRVLP